MLYPTGGAGAELMPREAEGQQATDQLPVVEKFSSVRPNSLDIFSPTREGQMITSRHQKKSYTSGNFVTFLFCFLQILEPSAQLEMCQLEEHRVKQEVPEVVWDSSAGCVLTLMACFHSYQFGSAVQRRRGSASHWSGQSGYFLSSQRRLDFTSVTCYWCACGSSLVASDLFIEINVCVSDCHSGASSHRKTPLGTPLVASAGRCFSPMSIFQTPPPIKEEEPVPAAVPEPCDPMKVITSDLSC